MSYDVSSLQYFLDITSALGADPGLDLLSASGATAFFYALNTDNFREAFGAIESGSKSYFI